MEQFRFVLPTEHSVTIDNLRLTVLMEHGANRESGVLCALHTHSYAEIFICIAGTLTVVSDRGRLTVEAGDGILVPSRVLHFLDEPERSERQLVFGLNMERRGVSDGRDLYAAFSAELGGGEPRRLSECGELRELAARIESTSDDVQQVFAIGALLSKLHACLEKMPEPRLPADDPGSGDLRRIIKLEGLLNTYFDTDIDGPKLAEMLYISERQLSRIVKKHYGKTLRRVIVDKRLSMAASMLTETDHSAEDIAIAVGFGTKASFYREFRQSFGITPMEYRRVYS